MHKVILFAFLVAATAALPMFQSQSQHSTEGYLKHDGVVETKTLNIGNYKTTNAYPDFRPYGREEAAQEKEYWLSRKDSIYNRAQSFAARIFTPKPIVDTIQEHEKYGNDGDIHKKVARTLINGFDALGNTVNVIVDVPYKAKDRITKMVTAALNAVGGKISGIN